jgi:Family of unknown function (DUF6056)
VLKQDSSQVDGEPMKTTATLEIGLTPDFERDFTIEGKGHPKADLACSYPAASDPDFSPEFKPGLNAGLKPGLNAELKPGLNAGLRAAMRRVAPWMPAFGVVGIFMMIGRWVYFVADDFCRAAQRQNLGLLGMQLHEYRTWSGRFTSTGLIAVTMRFGITGAHLVPAVLAGICFVLCTFAARRLPQSIMPKQFAPLAGTLGALYFFGLFENFGQSVLWLTGGMTYFVPYLLFGCALLCTFSKTQGTKTRVAKLSRVGAPAFAFFAVGCNEAVGATLVGALLITCLAATPALRRLLLPSTLSSILGFAVMVASPGNALRQAANPHDQSLLQTPIPAALSTLRLLGWLVTERPLLVFVAAMIGILLNNERGPRKGTGLLGFAFLGVSYGAVVLGFLSTGTPLTPRARISAIAPMIIAIVLAAWWANCRWRTSVPVERYNIKHSLSLFCAVAVIISATRSIVPAAADAKSHAKAAKESTRLLTLGTGTTTPIAVPGPDTVWGLANFAGEGDWVLRCADSYFKVKGTYYLAPKG